MSLPVQMFPMLTPAQISPVMTGISQANQLYQQSMQNQYLQPDMEAALRKQQLSNEITQAQANVAPQMSAAQLAYNQARTPNLNAATQYILSGQLPTAQAQAGLIGTEASKNQFGLSHPGTLLPGMAGQLGALAYLRNIMSAQGDENSAAPVPQMRNVNEGGAIPGIPSAGSVMPRSGNPNAQILPSHPYNSNGGSQNSALSALPSTNDLMNLGVKSFLAPIQKNIAQADYYQTRASGYNFQSLPPAEKSYTIAQAVGMGIDPMQATTLLNNGQTITSIAQSRGLDPNNLPTPIYAATPATVQLIQRRNQALNEINTIQPEITAGMAPYARQFANYSPSQIANAIQGDNPDQQARFLASRALQPEMASLRLKAMGGNIGIEAIKEVNNQSMGNIKSFQGLVSPKVYTSAQNYVDEWINQGANAANKIGLAGSVGNLNNGGQPMSNATMTGSKPAIPQVTSQSSSLVTMKAPDGNLFRIPSSNVRAAIKMGAVQQ